MDLQNFQTRVFLKTLFKIETITLIFFNGQSTSFLVSELKKVIDIFFQEINFSKIEITNF